MTAGIVELVPSGQEPRGGVVSFFVISAATLLVGAATLALLWSSPRQIYCTALGEESGIYEWLDCPDLFVHDYRHDPPSIDLHAGDVVEILVALLCVVVVPAGVIVLHLRRKWRTVPSLVAFGSFSVLVMALHVCVWLLLRSFPLNLGAMG